MAFFTDTHATGHDRPFLSRVFGGFVNWLDAVMEANGRCDQVAALSAKSDAELAQLGLKRDDIVRYVFRDVYFL